MLDGPDIAAQAVHTDQDALWCARTRGSAQASVPISCLVAVGTDHAAQPEAGGHAHGHRLPHASPPRPRAGRSAGCGLGPALRPLCTGRGADLHVDLVSLHVLEIHLPRLHQMRMHPLALRARPLLPGGHRALIQPERRHDGLQRTAVRQQRHHRRHHRGRRAQPKERCPCRRAKGAPTGVAAIAPLLVTMDADVPLPPEPPVAAVLVRAEFALRVHAVCSPDRGEQPRLSRACRRDPRFCHRPSSFTLNWGGTLDAGPSTWLSRYTDVGRVCRLLILSQRMRRVRPYRAGARRGPDGQRREANVAMYAKKCPAGPAGVRVGCHDSAITRIGQGAGRSSG